ncbi:MAG: TatD family hydrolase [Akkermansiaceae bacterium]|nr:TatD family hydrolase [Akkermansiaceae bacterium]
MSATWFDAHLHLQDSRLGDSRKAARAMKLAGVEQAVVNAVEPEDWRDVHALIAWGMGEEEAPELRPAYGVHPWKADRVREGWKEDLRDFLATHPEASLGEIGLDSWVDSPELETQRPIFRAQLEMARELEKTMSIHCLKAWGALYEELEDNKPTAPFLMHSYGGSIEFAEQLLPLGAYFSFSGYFLQERKSEVVEVFRKLPKDRILVESDAPDMAPPEAFIRHSLEDGHNHPANLPTIAEALAERLDMDTKELAELTANNARSCFQL